MRAFMVGAKMQQQNARHQIRGPVLGPLALALIILMLTGLAGLYHLVEGEDRAKVKGTLTRVEALLKEQLTGDAEALDMALYGVAVNHDFADPLRDHDRTRLAELAQPIYRHFREDHRITHFYIDDANRVNLLRAHDPDMFGDRIERRTTLEAERSGRTASGIELGPLGALTLRAVMPYRADGQVLGYFELGEEIGHVMGNIHDILSADLVVLLDKRRLSAGNWEVGRRLFGWLLPWSQFPTVVATASTIGEFDKPLLDLIAQASPSGDVPVSRLRLGARSIHFTPLPIYDAAGERVGSLLVGVDLTALSARSRTLMIAMAVLCVALGGGLVVFFHRLLGGLESRVHSCIDKMAMTNADLERIAFVTTTQLQEPLDRLNEASRRLSARSASSLDGEAKSDLNLVVAGTEEIRETLGALEDYFDLGLTGHRPEPVDLGAVFVAAVDHLRPALGDAELVAPPLPTVTANPVLLARAFFCLVEHAAAAKAPRRRLRLAVTAAEGAGGWSIIFADNGTGLEGDCQQTARLAMADRVAAAHGGKIEVERHQGIGTTVRMSIAAVAGARTAGMS